MPSLRTWPWYVDLLSLGTVNAIEKIADNLFQTRLKAVIQELLEKQVNELAGSVKLKHVSLRPSGVEIFL